MNTPRDETVSDQDVAEAWGAITGVAQRIGEIFAEALAPFRPRSTVHVFSGIDGTTGRPFWHITPEGEEAIRVEGQRGERCTRCMHVTLESGAAGCCVSVEPTDVAVCPNCEILFSAYDFTPHVLQCFRGWS